MDRGLPRPRRRLRRTGRCPLARPVPRLPVRGCWEDGKIPDVLEAIDSPRRLSEGTATAAAVLQRTREVPALTWGRDELGAGEMWNSNSLVAWLLAGSGHDMAAITPPAHGRAPGWAAGLQLARREHHGADRPHVPMVPTS